MTLLQVATCLDDVAIRVHGHACGVALKVLGQPYKSLNATWVATSTGLVWRSGTVDLGGATMRFAMLGIGSQ